MKRALLALIAFALLLTVAGCTIGDERWRAAADNPTFDEWADYSCQDATRFSQTTGPPAPLFPPKEYRIELRDGDDSFGERCELTLGNTGNTSYHGPASIFHTNDQLLVHFAVYIGDEFSFAPPGAPVNVPEEGGLIHQIKQLGACGTPALGIVATRTKFVVRNSDTPTCESNPMHTILEFPLVKNKWVQIAQLVKFSTDPNVGRYGLWYKTEGADWTWVGEVHTHTMKSPTDHPSTSCPESTPCSHARIGIYRDPDVQGTSVAYFDGYWVAEWRD